MHESEKSDSVVVAGKPTNKAARAVAELVEPRTGRRPEPADTRPRHPSRRRRSLSSLSSASPVVQMDYATGPIRGSCYDDREREGTNPACS